MNTTFRAGCLLAIWLLSATGLAAQTSKVEEDLQRADKQFNLYMYNVALRSYESILKRDPNNARALARVGDVYFQLNKPDEALTYYSQAAARNDADPEVLLRYGKALMQTGDYIGAKRWFLAYAEGNPTVGKHYAAMCDYAQQTSGKAALYDVRNEPLNTESADFGPAFYGGKVVYNSGRTDIIRGSQTGKSDGSGAGNQLFITQRNGSDGFLQRPSFLKSDLQNTYNEGPVSYSADGKRVAFCRNNFIDGTRQVAAKGITMSLYTADVVDGNWTNVRAFPYNGSDFATGFPCLSPDGQTLFFSSNMPSGMGGWDVYLSRFVGGDWATPRNLGPGLNTRGDEVTPYFDGENLYFSSDWHRGFGGLDVFRAAFRGGDPGEVYHLGPGVNSPRDDYGYIYDANRNTGYLTSNRNGGRGNEDLYQVRRKVDEFNIAVTDARNQAIAGAEVDFTNCGAGTYTTDADGLYRFSVTTGQADCRLTVRKDGYQESSVDIRSKGNRNLTVVLTALDVPELNGMVVDSRSKEGLQGVLVEAVPASKGRIIQVNTDYAGRYRIPVESLEKYEVNFVKNGYQSRMLSVRSGQAGDVRELETVEMATSGNSLAQTSGQPDQETDQFVTYSTGTRVLSQRSLESAQPYEDDAFRGWAIQLASTPEAITDASLRPYSGLLSHGNLYSRQEGRTNKIRLGIYETREDAVFVLREVARDKRFRDAFIVEEPRAETALRATPRFDNEYQPAQYGPAVTAKGQKTRKAIRSDVYYAVQVGSYAPDRPVVLSDFASLLNIGNVYVLTENNYHKVRVGVWTDPDEAEAAQTGILNRGFKGALVVVERVDDPDLDDYLITEEEPMPASTKPGKRSTVSPKGLDAESPTVYSYSNSSSKRTTKKPVAADDSEQYYIRLHTLSNPETFDEETVRGVGGEVETRLLDNGLTVILLGGFEDLEQALLANNRLKAKGFKNTYVVKDANGKLVRLRYF